MRRAYPYRVEPHNSPSDVVVGGVPTTATRRIFGYDAFKGIITRGYPRMMVAVRHPYSAAVFPAFPLVRESDAAPDAIGTSKIIAINNFSPISHRNPLTVEIPPAAINPRPKQPAPNLRGRGTGGAYTIPQPRVEPQWPTSSQWLASRLVR